MKLQLASSTRLLFSHTCVSLLLFPGIDCVEKTVLFAEEELRTPRSRRAHQVPTWFTVSACPGCGERQEDRLSGKPITWHSLSLHCTPPLGKQNQRGINGAFPVHHTQWHFFSSHFCGFSPYQFLSFTFFPLLMFFPVLSHIIFFPQIPAALCMLLQTFLHVSLLPAPCPSPCFCFDQDKRFSVFFSCSLSSESFFFGCVILPVLRKALGHKGETAFSSSSVLLLQKACSVRSSWTAPRWKFVWLPKQPKQTWGRATPPILSPGTGIILVGFFPYLLKTKQHQLPFTLWCYINPCFALAHDWVSPLRWGNISV